MRTLIICSTPYTIYNALNYTISKIDEEVDLMLILKTPVILDIHDRIVKKGVFKSVFKLKDFQYKWYFEYISFLIYIFPKLALRLLGCKSSIPEGYDKVISQNFYFMTLVSRFNKDAKYYLIEDGLGSYVNRTSLPNARNKYLRYIDKCLFNGSLLPDVKGQYVYRPNFLLNDGRLEGIELGRFDMDNWRLFKDVFNYSENNLSKLKNIIVLGDSWMIRNHCSIKEHSFNKYEFIQNYVTPFLNIERVLYRPHPSEVGYNKYISFSIDDKQNMWELDCINNISDNSIILNFYSTAAVTPKLLFDKEPYLIFFYKFFDCYQPHIAEYTAFIEKIRNLYRIKNKIIILDKIEDIPICLSNLTNQ